MNIRIPKLYLLIGGVLIALAVRAHFAKPSIRPGWKRLTINVYDSEHPKGRTEIIEVPPGSPGAELAQLGQPKGERSTP